MGQQAESTVGPQAGGAIDQIVRQGSQRKTAGTVSALLGFLVLVFSATGAFAQMQYSLNTIWEVQPSVASPYPRSPEDRVSGKCET